MYVSECTPKDTCRGQKIPCGSFPSFHHTSPKYWIQVIRLGGKHSYLFKAILFFFWNRLSSWLLTLMMHQQKPFRCSWHVLLYPFVWSVTMARKFPFYFFSPWDLGTLELSYFEKNLQIQIQFPKQKYGYSLIYIWFTVTTNVTTMESTHNE